MRTIDGSVAGLIPRRRLATSWLDWNSFGPDTSSVGSSRRPIATRSPGLTTGGPIVRATQSHQTQVETPFRLFLKQLEPLTVERLRETFFFFFFVFSVSTELATGVPTLTVSSRPNPSPPISSSG